MSAFARIAEDANRFDDMLADGKLNSASLALQVMGGAIKTLGPESGAALFEHSCAEWLARCVRLADAKNSAREPSAEHWTEWFAEAIRRRTAREMALVKKVRS
jgi:hypothetical protein